MKLLQLVIFAAAATSCTLAVAFATHATAEKPASPIYGVTIPDGYRQWQLIAPAQEAAPLNELRAVLGNAIAIQAYREGTLPFPDGAVLAKLAWKRVPSSEFEPASVPGAATTVQFMVKDSKRYAATGGWGFGRFINGKPADETQHRTCYACHHSRVKNHDLVFTRYAK
ncbi:Cytochrome C oxidase subunit III [Rhodanobacter sp. Root179]|uniref:cytochrome P460 family protein n=1 Tax=unclassified Rhodanobacter TaxID=2621553 RepID=UPI0006FF936E|nr:MULTISPECIES: cytochrome P460 family protein [unclassified Rhodanobacter]KQZ69174.1 cytochrome C oxidase subunit III [Rhodanobacter sp. Root561]KRB43953.1 cytochrome C oxidase subunit III [Rhodanobacter sp. Root179]